MSEKGKADKAAMDRAMDELLVQATAIHGAADIIESGYTTMERLQQVANIREALDRIYDMITVGRAWREMAAEDTVFVGGLLAALEARELARALLRAGPKVALKCMWAALEVLAHDYKKRGGR